MRWIGLLMVAACLWGGSLRAQSSEGDKPFSSKEELQKMADAGNAEAQMRLAVMYYTGSMDGKPDLKKARYWYEKAAAQDQPTALFNLGVMYEKGEGVEKDADKALVYYCRAADKGLVEAQLNAAVEFRDLRQDLGKAAHYFQMAADHGHKAAQREFGRMLLEGQGVKRDLPLALKYLDAAASTGDALAHLLLANVYSGKVQGLAPDPAKMVDHLWQAAGDDSVEAVARLGYCYEMGIGLPRDPKTAVRWYQRAADKDSSEAMVNLGNCYQRGIGVGRDPRKAVELYQRAAKLKFPQAYHNLGIAYLNGFGVERDEALALDYLRQAADLGVAEAQYSLGVYWAAKAPQEPGSPERAKAFEYLLAAARQGLPAAMTETGFCYLKGRGTMMNIVEAEQWFRKAAAQNHPEAQEALRMFFDDPAPPAPPAAARPAPASPPPVPAAPAPVPAKR